MKKNLLDIDYNNSPKAGEPCLSECKKINNKINNRKLSKNKDAKVPHILNIFGKDSLPLITSAHNSLGLPTFVL